MKRYAHIIAALLLIAALTGCAESSKKPQTNAAPLVNADADTPAETDPNAADLAGDDDFDLLDENLDEQLIEIADPLEGLNRIVFKFNDVLYTVVLDPLAGTYEEIVPEPLRINIDNFFQNVTTPGRYVNCLLQGKGDAADIELRRFWINSTEGILGFNDPALEKHGLEQVKEDFGQTLAHWGVGNGFYIVWPLLGPSTLRDSVGLAGDYVLNPTSYISPCEIRYSIKGLGSLNKASFHTGEYEALTGDAVDPYIMLRQAYLQYRAKLIKE